MHLASAAGVPVVAVFGLTDPSKTGPIGRGARIVRPDGARASRAIARDDPKAVAALASIPASRVADECLAAIGRASPSGSSPDPRKDVRVRDFG